MAPENKDLVWLAGVLAAILAVALTIYLIRSLKRGVITFPARVSFDVSRAANPGQFWFAILGYLVADVFAITCLAIRLYRCIFSRL